MLGARYGFVTNRFVVSMGVVLVAVSASSAPGQDAGPLRQGPLGPQWGGQIVRENIPYQPSVLMAAPTPDEGPIFLDEWMEPVESPVVIHDTWGDACVECEDGVVEVQPQLPPGVRQGVFQKLFFTGAWQPQPDARGLGWGDLETGVVLGFPFLRRDTPLVVTPRFAVHLLDRPLALDLPQRVYDADVELRHLRRFGQGPWAMNVAVTLGHYSDWESSDADAFRVTGQAFAVYESTPEKQWVIGIVYLNREDVDVIPAAGLIYAPTPDVKLEAILPRPRIAWRMPGAGSLSGSERWLYVGGEFGGGVWSIQRPVSLTQDVLTYRDFRVLLGCERKSTRGLSRRLEAGYVFGRQLEFASAAPPVALDDTLFLRAGLTY